jgi:hypothetical protein
MWRISGSSLPPMMHEVLYRDRTWDYEVAMMLQVQDYFRDQHKIQGVISKAQKGLRGQG